VLDIEYIVVKVFDLEYIVVKVSIRP